MAKNETTIDLNKIQKSVLLGCAGLMAAIFISYFKLSSRSGVIETIPEIGSSSREATQSELLTVPGEVMEPLTLEELSLVKEFDGSHEFYERVVFEFLEKVEQVKESKDQSKVESRLKPVLQKFYYLRKRFSAKPSSEFHLSPYFQERIATLEVLWAENPYFGGMVDQMFYDFGLLQHEHVPYQLRKKLLPNNITTL